MDLNRVSTLFTTLSLKGRPTLKCRMKAEAAKAYQQIAKKGDDEYSVMSMFKAVAYSSQPKIEEHEVGECVDDFGRILGGVIILKHVSTSQRAELLEYSTSSHQLIVEVTGFQ